MEKSVFTRWLAMSILMVGMVACNTIYLRYPIITESNAHSSYINNRYWLKYGSVGTEPTDAYEIRNNGEINGNKATKLWIAKNGIETFYLRYKATNKTGFYLGQLTRPDGKSIISLVIVHSNESFTIYEPTPLAFAFAKNNGYLKALQKYIIVDDVTGSLTFDEIICASYPNQILAYLESMIGSYGTPYDTDKYFRSYATFKATQNRNLIEAIWMKQQREEQEKANAQANAKTNFYKTYHVGDKWVLDNGWGVLGYDDVIIVDLDYSSWDNVKIKNLENYESKWVRNTKLLTPSEAANNKLNVAVKIIDRVTK